jgi:phosphoadenosine phosphosulfate reductase
MLIPSHRHTAEDLRLWREHERADRQHASRLDAKIERAIDTVRHFASEPCYAGISWGKDSVVLAHLIAISGMQIPTVWFRVEPIKNPGCEAVRDAFLQVWTLNYCEIERWCTWDNGWHASGTLESAAAEAEQAFGVRRILGIRGDESNVRRLTCLRNGEASENSCRPLAWWTAQDVMGYLTRFDLPIHPVYAMLGGGRYDRKWLRVASLGGRRGDGIGRQQWEREYYGDCLRRIEAGLTNNSPDAINTPKREPPSLRQTQTD